MPLYRVRPGERLGHDGKVLEGGARLELARAVAEDQALRGALEEIDEKGNPVAPVPANDLDRFRTHERVGFLRERLTAARNAVTDLDAQLAAEEQRLVDEVTAVQAATQKPTKAPQPKAADTKE
jgi:small-conductance mechanosensitive channel